MCDERRATFQRVRMDEEGNVKECYSITLSRVQAWASVVVAVFTVVASLFGAAAWTRASVAGVASEVFDQQLEIFHDRAQPAIEAMVDTKLDLHTATSDADALERVHGLETREAARDATMEEMNKRFDRLEGKIDDLTLLIRNGGGR